MIVCDSIGFAMVMIPKVASNSLNVAMHNSVRKKEIDSGLANGFHKIKRYSQHKTVRQGRLKYGNRWDRWFKFAFVRNPWDRWLSWYYYRTYNPAHNIDYEYMGKPLEWLQFRGGQRRHNAYIWNQVDYLTYEDGRLGVDFIGSYGDIYKSLRYIWEKLNLPGSRVPIINGGMRRIWPNDESKAVRDYISEKCKKDIDYFKFTRDSELKEFIVA